MKLDFRKVALGDSFMSSLQLMSEIRIILRGALIGISCRHAKYIYFCFGTRTRTSSSNRYHRLDTESNDSSPSAHDPVLQRDPAFESRFISHRMPSRSPLHDRDSVDRKARHETIVPRFYVPRKSVSLNTDYRECPVVSPPQETRRGNADEIATARHFRY